MIKAIWVALGGAMGAVLRYYVILLCGTRLGRVFPLGVFSVNVLGSFLIGICAAFLLQSTRASGAEFTTTFVMVGLLGGFTTFSSFSLDVFTMLSDGRFLLALANILANVVICVLATAVGFYLVTKVA